MKPLLKRIFKRLSYACYLALATWALLELAYRYQRIDFYATELNRLNPDSVLHARPGKSRILLLGDSFSAQMESYVNTLRDSLPGADIINAAVPGTGIREAFVIASDKIERFPPDLLVYQVYAGNDLWDIRKTCNSSRISTLRNIYWFLSDYSLSLRYLNYISGQVKSRFGASVEKRELKQDVPFSPDTYSRRELLLLRAEPALVHHSILAAGKRKNDLEVWFEKMDKIIAALPERTRTVVLLVIPHGVQVNDFYRKNLELLGAAPFGPEIQETEYPFLRLIRQHYAGRPHVQVYSPLLLFQHYDSTNNRLYYENDPHLNARGHAVLGQALGAFLRKQAINRK